MMFTLPPKLPAGAVLILGIKYPDMLGAENKIFEYAFIKAGGLWYGSGTGKTPQQAGWGAVENWLGKYNRKLVSVKLVTATEEIYTGTVQVKSRVGALDDNAMERRAERLALEPGLG